MASDDPPTWAGAGRVHVIPPTGGSPRPLAETSDGFGRYSELVGWSADGKKLYFTEVQGTSLKLLALPLRRPARRDQPRRGHVCRRRVPQRPAHRVRLRLGDAEPGRRKPSSAPVDRFEPSPVSRVNRDLPDVPLGRTEVDPLEIDRRPARSKGC